MKKISDLKNIWANDKEAFAAKELGGLHSFVKDVLESEELFNLKQGKESSKISARKNEFTIETSKQGRRADFVIYINGDEIVIPVEVEKHNNIEKGVEQLFQYQKDWMKKYGLLTDGNEWRFYKSSQYKRFFINDILNNPKEFVVYWQFYIKPENYYIELFNPSIQLSLFNDKLDLNIFENRTVFFDEITQVIKNFKGKMLAIGVWSLNLNFERDKVAVETAYAYLIQFILYKTIVDNEYKKFKNEYDKTLNKIAKAIQDKDFYSIIINEIKNISEYISENIYKPFESEQKSINEKLIENLKGDLTIDDIAPWLDIILFINRYNFAGLKNEIFGFIYENYLKDLYQDKNKGQFFTDPAVVNFMLDEIGYTGEELKEKANKNEISIIDPSCGAGTFLYSSVDRIIEAFDKGTEKQSKLIEDLIDKNIFGMDIEEFPLYLAEMNILMRLLPLIVNDNYENPIDNKLKIFKTKDSISEFLNAGISSKEKEYNMFSHLEKTALDYPSFMREEKDLKEMLKSLQEKNGVRGRFDYVIGNPPYISYNECCKQKMEFTKKIKNKNDSSITMGNVYGINLNTVPNRIKTYPPKPNLYAFFIALGLALLKEGGKLCFIIPQTILTARDLDVLRYHLSKFTTIEKIITFQSNMFVGRGLKQNKPIATSSLILVIKKQFPKLKHKIKVINFTPYFEKQEIDFEKYLNSRNKKSIEICQSIIFEKLDNWNFLTYPIGINNFAAKYIENSDSFDIYRLFEKSIPRFKDKFYFDVGFILKNNLISKKKEGDMYSILDFKNFKGYSKYNATDFYPKDNSKIELTRSNQGHITLSPKYSIVWRIKNPERFYLTDEPIIFNMGKSSIITSNNKNEMMYLLSVLNSGVSKKILEFYLKTSSEKDYLVAILPVKHYIRVPIISAKNQFIKDEIIKQTEIMLSLEDYQLKDFVEFTTTKQKFSNIKVDETDLVLIDAEDKEIRQKIKFKHNFVKNLIEKKFINTLLNINDVSLNDLKYMEAVDYKEQETIKDYIDDLIFALYFDVSISKIGIAEAENIKKICRKNRFYEMLFFDDKTGEIYATT
ncbi:MAG TPA: Eco57I restriction-modification methylase domain-containing protein [bacterium]|nr:Eco57I restriction-modification methylase domain-containing protein [bacterium]HPN30199.1 Eco57I restriction-modification methylase domain-containing protein [bacterium]